MKKNKAFTIVELIIVMAVGVILFGIIAGLSVLTSNIVKSNKTKALCMSQYKTGKSEIEKFMSTYSSDFFQFYLDSDASVKIYNSENYLVAKIQFDSEKKEFSVYETDDNHLLVEAKKEKLSEVTNIKFEFDESSNLMKCSVSFVDYETIVFLINLGGIKVGNLY